MEPITADISIKGASGTTEVKATRMRFSPSRCFAFDKGVHDRRCLAMLGEHLKSKDGLAGVMANVQTPLLQIPHVYYYLGTLWNAESTRRTR